MNDGPLPMGGQDSAAPRAPGAPRSRGSSRVVDSMEFEEAFGEPLSRALDLRTWQPHEDIAAILEGLRREVRDSIGQEDAMRRRIRSDIFPRLATRPHAVAGAGVYQVTPEHVADVHRSLLLNGGVEACDGTVSFHDALPLTVIRIGVSLVGYNGTQSRYSQQFFRRDLRLREGDVLAQLIHVLERRGDRAGIDRHEQRDLLTDLSRSGIMAYAERAVLARESTAPWRMGHGSPMPVELLSGSGSRELFEAGAQVVRDLVEGHRRFVFVPSAPRERDWLTVGQALEPLQFAVVDSMEDRLQRMVDASQGFGPYYGELRQRFVDEVGPQIVMGMYRVAAASPAMIFYAHVDHAAEAAVIAMADSALQVHRGFPLLIDLADRYCSEHFGQGTLRTAAQEAYADAGVPFRYWAERDGRGKG